MTPGSRITVFGILITLSACSIQRDAPEFVYPASTLGDNAAAPVLQPTQDLIVDASSDTQTYRRITSGLDGRAYRLRRAVQSPGGG